MQDVFTFIYIFKFFFFKVLFVYLTERVQAGGMGEREAGSLLSREPGVGLDPRNLGS